MEAAAALEQRRRQTADSLASSCRLLASTVTSFRTFLLRKVGFRVWSLRGNRARSHQETRLGPGRRLTSRDPGPRRRPASDRQASTRAASAHPLLRASVTSLLMVFRSLDLGRLLQKTPTTRSRAREQKAPTRLHSTYTETHTHTHLGSVVTATATLPTPSSNLKTFLRRTLCPLPAATVLVVLVKSQTRKS